MRGSDAYILGRGYMPSIRLNYQASLWREILGFDIHPTLRSTLRPDLRIADIATGTGVWLCDVASLPDVPDSVQFDGFDVSGDNYLSSYHLPANIRLHTQDFNLDPPSEFLGKFDIVHVRLLLAVIENNHPRLVLDHAKKLLKPGGYLQWDELDPSVFRILGPSEGSTECLQQLLKVWRYTKQSDWVADLGDIVQKNDFELIAHAAYTDRPYQRQLHTSLWCMLAEEHSAILSQSDATKEKGEKVRQLGLGAYQEMLQGSAAEHTIRVTIARK